MALRNTLSIPVIVPYNIIIPLIGIHLTGCKESWTDYLHTWNMEGYSFSVIMGDMTSHNSGLRRVSLQIVTDNITILYTSHNLLYILYTPCVRGVWFDSLLPLIFYCQDGAYQRVSTHVEMELVFIFSRKVCILLLHQIGSCWHWDQFVDFKNLAVVNIVH